MRNPSNPRSVSARLEFPAGLGLALLSFAVFAADWPASQYDPAKPSPGDVILPMPCGGKMVFRSVETLGGGVLGDQRVRLGESQIGAGRGYMEGAVDAYVSGAFPTKDPNKRYFLLGKYEVTERQYQAVMGSEKGKDGACQALSEENFPKTRISWFEAANFADRYTQWLLQNVPDRLPRDGKSVGFVRLPTEVEWEFAARGGGAVGSKAEFEDRVFPMQEEMYHYVQYQGTESSNGKVQYIGQLTPNPLGLYDILGNVDEIAFDLFHLTLHSRWHGRSGSFVVRGGNFATPAESISSALRREEPYYVGNQPRRADTTGFRVAVAGPVVSEQNLRTIESEWTGLKPEPSELKQPATSPLPPPVDSLLTQRLQDAETQLRQCREAQPGAAVTSCADPLAKLSGESKADPLADLSDLAAKTDHPVLRRRLSSLWQKTAALVEVQNEKRSRAAREALRTAAMVCQKLRDDEYNLIRGVDMVRKNACTRDPKGQDCMRFDTKLAEMRRRANYNLGFYADSVLELAQSYPMEILTTEKDLLLTSLEQRAYKDFMPFVSLLYEHARRFSGNGKQDLEAWYQACAAIPTKP